MSEKPLQRDPPLVVGVWALSAPEGMYLRGLNESHLQTLIIYKLGFNQNFHTFTSTNQDRAV